ncbi:MAG TPA: alanine racemase [Candidatus Cloacimonadota bacterium]|nr:alanine racemase [Candidatus Cloacimonadota bacterium]
MVQNLIRPTLLLDRDKCRKNIETMAKKAAAAKLIFRPHFKTHQSLQIGEWFQEFGVKKITVSSVKMARYFADAGWSDIVIAFPFNQLEIDGINELAEKINLTILLIHPESVFYLKEHLKHKVDVYIKIDCGYHRCGILAEDTAAISKLISVIFGHGNLRFKGFLTHSGHAYHTTSVKQIMAIHEVTNYKMNLLKQQFKEKYPFVKVSIGDTPCCTLAERFPNVDEMRPGNFVFYDMMQVNLGVCQPSQIAVALACPIVSIDKERLEIVIYGGAVYLSKEYLVQEDGSHNFGSIVNFTETGWTEPITGMYVSALSQEHGIIKVLPEQIGQFHLGDVIGVLPVHSCLTANLMREYVTLDGEVIDRL